MRLYETVCFRVGERNDRQGDRNVGHRGTARAAVEFHVHVQEIVIADVFRVRCWRQLAQHENLLWRPWHHLRSCKKAGFLLSLHGLDHVSDVGEVKRHFLGHWLCVQGGNTRSVFVLNDVEAALPVVESSEMKSLHNLELNLINFELAFMVVHDHVSESCFIGVEHILVELDIESSLSLSATAAGSHGNFLLV